MTTPASSLPESPTPKSAWSFGRKVLRLAGFLLAMVLIQVGLRYAIRVEPPAPAIVAPSPPAFPSSEMVSGPGIPAAPASPKPHAYAYQKAQAPTSARPPQDLVILPPPERAPVAQVPIFSLPPAGNGPSEPETIATAGIDLTAGPLIPVSPPDHATEGLQTDAQLQRRLFLQQRIAELEAAIESDARTVTGLGFLGQGFESVPEIVRAEPPEDRTQAVAGLLAELLAGGMANQAGRERTEAQARLDANRWTLQELRNELAGLGR